MMDQISAIDWTSLLIVLIGGAVMWGKVKQKVSSNDKQIEQLRRGLYNKDGTLVYITREECGLAQGRVCGKIDDLKHSLDKIDEKVDKQAEIQNTGMEKLAGFMGKIEGYMEANHNRVGANHGD